MQSYSQRPVNRLSCVGAVEFPFERFSAFTIWNFAQHCWKVDNLSFFNICEMFLTRQRVVCFWREVAGRTVDMVFICLSLMFVNALWLSFRKVQTEAVSREQGNGGRMWIFSLHLIQGQTVCRTLKTEGFILAERMEGILLFYLLTASSNTTLGTLCFPRYKQRFVWTHRSILLIRLLSVITRSM